MAKVNRIWDEATSFDGGTLFVEFDGPPQAADFQAALQEWLGRNPDRTIAAITPQVPDNPKYAGVWAIADV